MNLIETHAIQALLENQHCRIHQQKPVITVLQGEKVKIETCCYLFRSQLYYKIDGNDQNAFVEISC